MQSERYIAELQPSWRMQFEVPAPLATKCLFMTQYGSAVVGHWYTGCEFVAWCPLPRLSAEQKAKIERHIYGDRVSESESGEGC